MLKMFIAVKPCLNLELEKIKLIKGLNKNRSKGLDLIGYNFLAF